MDKFEEQEMKKIRPIKKNWYDRLLKQTVVKGKKLIIIRDKLKDKTIRDIWTLFETEDDYYESKRESNFLKNNYIKNDSNGDKNRNLSLDEYLNKIKPFLRNMIINIQTSVAWKIQLTIQ